MYIQLIYKINENTYLIKIIQDISKKRALKIEKI
jgi:hypothetical protein